MMELLDRYLYDVGRRLPAKQREDIEKELKSLLTDALEARTGDREATAEDIAAVLTEFGRPEEVAARYTGEQYLIGPRYFGLYWMLLKLVLGAVALGLCVSMALGVFFEQPADQGAMGFVAQFLGSVVSGALAAVGSVTVVFAIIERVDGRRGKTRFRQKWDPKDLPPVPKQTKGYKRADSIVAIVFIILGLVLFNFYPELLALYFKGDQGAWRVVPLLSDAVFANYLPLWNIGWALALALHVVLLTQGRWSEGTRLGHIALEVFSIVVAAYMLNGPQFLSPALLDAIGPVLQPEALFRFVLDFRWVFLIAIIGSAVEIAVTAVRLVREKIS